MIRIVFAYFLLSVFTLEYGGLSAFLKSGNNYDMLATEKEEDSKNKEEKEEKEDKEEKDRKADKLLAATKKGSCARDASYYLLHQRHHFCEAHITDILSPPPEV